MKHVSRIENATPGGCDAPASRLITPLVIGPRLGELSRLQEDDERFYVAQHQGGR